MVITHKLSMDLERNVQNQWIEMPQGGVNSRKIRLVLTANRQPWMIPEGANVLIQFRKPDGTCGEYDTLPNGTSAWAANENILTVSLAPQVLTSSGTVLLNIVLLQDDCILNTFPVEIRVRGAKTNGMNRLDASEDYFYVANVLPGPMYAQVGQFLSVSEVDEQGRVVRVQAVDVVDGKDGIGISKIEIVEV